MLRARNYTTFVLLSASYAASIAVGCGGTSRVPVSSGIGPSPSLPSPDGSLIPVVNVVKARGWADGQAPVAAAGTVVTPLATGLEHPRWVYVLPNGDVLVAE